MIDDQDDQAVISAAVASMLHNVVGILALVDPLLAAGVTPDVGGYEHLDAVAEDLDRIGRPRDADLIRKAMASLRAAETAIRGATLH